MTKILALLFVLLCTISISNATSVSGGIYSSTTWTKANSPYVVSGNLVVFDVATLTIEPGVQVLFEALASIELRGRLVAVGTTIDSITFTATTPTSSWWKGIKAVTSSVGGGAQITAQHCYFAYAYTLFDFDYAYQGPYTFKNCRFYKNQIINYDAPIGKTIIDYCYFEENATGPYGGGDDGTMYVTNSWFVNNGKGIDGGNVDRCVFIGNTTYGAYMYQGITNSYFFNNKIGIKADHHHDTKIQYNEIHDNEIGVVIDRMWQQSDIVFRNNKICNNTDWNVRYDYTNSVDISHNCWCTTDSSAIRAKIRDGYVSTQYGLLYFNTWDTCSMTTPFPLAVQPKINQTNVIKAYPNPVANLLTLEFGITDNGATYLITDLMGKEVQRNVVTSSKQTIDISQWPAGMYVVRCISDNNSSMVKVIKE